MRSGRLNAASAISHLAPARVVRVPAIRADTISRLRDRPLYDLGGRNPEIRGREIGAEMHHGEQGFSPDSHAGCLAGGDHHHPPEIICDVLRIDTAKFRLEAGELQPLHHVRCFHEAEMQEDAGDASADRH